METTPFFRWEMKELNIFNYWLSVARRGRQLLPNFSRLIDTILAEDRSSRIFASGRVSIDRQQTEKKSIFHHIPNSRSKNKRKTFFQKRRSSTLVSQAAVENIWKGNTSFKLLLLLLDALEAFDFSSVSPSSSSSQKWMKGVCFLFPFKKALPILNAKTPTLWRKVQAWNTMEGWTSKRNSKRLRQGPNPEIHTEFFCIQESIRLLSHESR